MTTKKMTAEKSTRSMQNPRIRFPPGLRFVGDPDSASRYLCVSPKLYWPRCAHAPRPMTDRCQAGSVEPSNTSCEKHQLSRQPTQERVLRFR